MEITKKEELEKKVLKKDDESKKDIKEENKTESKNDNNEIKN